MKVAVLIDGGFFLKRAQKLIPKFESNAKKTANLIVKCAHEHVERNEKDEARRRELYRIFYYDCPPLDKKVHLPISKKALNYSEQDTYRFRTSLYEELRSKRKVALRLGELKETDWQLKPSAQKDLLQGKREWQDLKDEDFRYGIRQKGVDSRIAVDITALALKGFVDQIVLIAGDADFVPAGKLARREGIDFILDPLGNPINPDLNEHIDGCHSTRILGKDRLVSGD